ncbi:MAG: pirin family protein, partial [Bacteroidales bacterium]|nr:pirin family protein [Bacteroidales bacterium]
MVTYRKVNEIIASKQVMEGAGVKLNRVFGYYEVPLFDPFLLLDHFKSENPDDFMAGFPWHPHRGIETVTYILEGKVRHGDSLGNNGIIESGDVQWMTAGSGIIHEEMPENSANGIEGFQLWVNLSAKNKMNAPRYQEIKKRRNSDCGDT